MTASVVGPLSGTRFYTSGNQYEPRSWLFPHKRRRINRQQTKSKTYGLSDEQKNNGFLRSTIGGRWVNVTYVILLALTVNNGQEVGKPEGNISKPHFSSVTNACRPNERIVIKHT